MFEIRRKFTISASHFMPGDPGPCGQMHGHNFDITVAFRGQREPTGMVINALAIDDGIASFKRLHDHRVLNETMAPELPTIESLAFTAFRHFVRGWQETAWVEVDEGLGISCRYEPGVPQ